jgi:glyoxylase-like metal-dependent hydrolase (beta-lactamase superfamily II)
MTEPIQVYRSRGGDRVYRIPLCLFPELSGFAHLVVCDGFVALVDTGSGFGDSNDHLEAGLAAVRADHGEPIAWSDLTHILITHGHIDHFGGLHYVRERSTAPLGVHELDRRVLIRSKNGWRSLLSACPLFCAKAVCPSRSTRT